MARLVVDEICLLVFYEPESVAPATPANGIVAPALLVQKCRLPSRVETISRIGEPFNVWYRASCSGTLIPKVKFRASST